jgi:hypothetical protein
MNTMIKLVAASACALALAACDFEQRPDSAPDQGGAGMSQPKSPGAAPMSPGGGAGRTSPGGGAGSAPSSN